MLPEGGDELDEALGEAGELVRGEFFVLADVGEDFKYGAIGPYIGAGKHLDLFDLDFGHEQPLWDDH